MFWFFLCKTKLDKTALLSRLRNNFWCIKCSGIITEKWGKDRFYFLHQCYFDLWRIGLNCKLLFIAMFSICRARDYRIFNVLHLSHQPLLLKFARFHLASSIPVSLQALINDEWEKWSSDLGRQFKQLSLFDTWKIQVAPTAFEAMIFATPVQCCLKPHTWERVLFLWRTRWMKWIYINIIKNSISAKMQTSA